MPAAEVIAVRTPNWNEKLTFKKGVIAAVTILLLLLLIGVGEFLQWKVLTGCVDAVLPENQLPSAGVWHCPAARIVVDMGAATTDNTIQYSESSVQVYDYARCTMDPDGTMFFEPLASQDVAIAVTGKYHLVNEDTFTLTTEQGDVYTFRRTNAASLKEWLQNVSVPVSAEEE